MSKKSHLNSKKCSQISTESYAMMLEDRLVIVNPGMTDGFTDAIEPEIKW
jgi:hypothetical protein